MRRLLAVSLGIVFLATLVTSTSTTLVAATKTIAGKVTAVSDDSVTVSGKDGEWKLAVDGKTKVVGRGLGTKAKAMEEEKKPAKFSEFVRMGDEVSAKFDDVTKRAEEVRVTKPAPDAPKK
jgi:hypothetical protein